MILSPMKFKDYVWPHNPRVYEIEFKKDIAAHAVPFGLFSMQNMGRRHRVFRGEGEFTGGGAYAQFKKLATVFYDPEPGILTHPLWDTTTAFFSALRLKQEPTENYVSYEFEFCECAGSAAAKLTALGSQLGGTGSGSLRASAAKKLYTAVYGDCLWSIASRNGLTLTELLALNPQIRNPNVLHVGDVIRLS